MKIKSSKLFKVVALFICFSMLFEQSGFAQVAGQLDISGQITAFRNSLVQDKFRPLHLRYLQYDAQLNNFKTLVDKGNLKSLSNSFVEQSTKTLLNYFLIGVSLPNDAFWVNLRPDAQDNIIDPLLAQTDIGKILLEADVQLKKDTARFTSPETPEGKEYWDKLYIKAAEVFGSQNVTIPTLTRPWIVPDEIIIRQADDSAYIYKATLKVMLEEDYLKGSAVYNFEDDRAKELNTYAAQILREKIIPKLTQEINIAKRYAGLRQVYYSFILAQWFKQKFVNQGSVYSNLIDRSNLTGLISKEAWSKTTYFNQYQKSFKDGEYNFKVPVSTAYGQVIRSYFSGGIMLGGSGADSIGGAMGRGGFLGGSRDVFKAMGERARYVAALFLEGSRNANLADIQVKGIPLDMMAAPQSDANNAVLASALPVQSGQVTAGQAGTQGQVQIGPISSFVKQPAFRHFVQFGIVAGSSVVLGLSFYALSASFAVAYLGYFLGVLIGGYAAIKAGNEINIAQDLLFSKLKHTVVTHGKDNAVEIHIRKDLAGLRSSPKPFAVIFNEILLAILLVAQEKENGNPLFQNVDKVTLETHLLAYNRSGRNNKIPQDLVDFLNQLSSLGIETKNYDIKFPEKLNLRFASNLPDAGSKNKGGRFAVPVSDAQVRQRLMQNIPALADSWSPAPSATKKPTSAPVAQPVALNLAGKINGRFVEVNANGEIIDKPSEIATVLDVPENSPIVAGVAAVIRAHELAEDAALSRGLNSREAHAEGMMAEAEAIGEDEDLRQAMHKLWDALSANRSAGAAIEYGGLDAWGNMEEGYEGEGVGKKESWVSKLLKQGRSLFSKRQNKNESAQEGVQPTLKERLAVVVRPGVNVQESKEAFEYADTKQNFLGVDLEHFVHAQLRLNKRELALETLRKVLAKLGLNENLSSEIAYRRILEKLAETGYSKELIDIINEYDSQTRRSNYSNPRLDVTIIDQNGDPRAQGIFEAVSNSLDALGFKIGQFGKGVKQIIDWLGATGVDRIDVYTHRENNKAYQLTILKDRNNQNYIQIKEISINEFKRQAQEASKREIEKGTVVKITTKETLPLTENGLDETRRNSQQGISDGIHKRFPFVTAVEIDTQIGDNNPEKVNGFHEKVVIVPADEPAYGPQDTGGRFVFVRLNDNSITIVDNGSGMDAGILSGMFVPGGGTKTPEFLNKENIDKELKKVKVVHDKTLPHRISFARQGEVIFTVDIPEDVHPDATMPGGGGLMLELGLFLDVQESRDRIVLRSGSESALAQAISYMVGQIVRHRQLSPEDKIKYINSIVIGLDGLVKGNDNNGNVIKSIRQQVMVLLEPLIADLKSNDYAALPYQSQFDKLSIPPGKKVIYVHDNLFGWGASGLRELGVEGIPYVKLEGDRRLLTAAFNSKDLKGVSVFNRLWHAWLQNERVPIIKTDRFVIIPFEFGKRLQELAVQRAKGLSLKEKLEFGFLIQLVKIITDEQVNTDYEVSVPKETLSLDDIQFSESKNDFDRRAVGTFLTKPPALPGKRVFKQIGQVPADSNQKYVLLKNGSVIEIGTGKVISPEGTVQQLTPLINGFYKVVTEDYSYIVNLSQAATGIDEETLKEGSPGVLLSTAKTRGGIAVSADKEFAYELMQSKEIPPVVYDLRDGKIFKLSDFQALSDPQEGFIDKNYYQEIQFSSDGQFMMVRYSSEDLAENFVAVYNLNSRTLISQKKLPASVFRVTVNPLGNVAFVLSQATSSSGPYQVVSLLDLSTGAFIETLEEVSYARVDATGSYVMLMYNSGRMAVYDIENKKLLDHLPNGEPILNLLVLYKVGDVKPGIVAEYRSASGDIAQQRFSLNESGEFVIWGGEAFKLVERVGFNGVRFLNKVGLNAGQLKLEDIFAEISTTKLGLDQRLGAPGIYKHPKLNLIIVNTDPDSQYAIHLDTGKHIYFKGEIFAQGQSASGEPFILCRIGSNVLRQTEGRDLLDSSHLEIYEISALDGVPTKFMVTKEPGKTTYLLKLLPGVWGIGFSTDTTIDSLKYTEVYFDGKYFVFIDPLTGDTAYLDAVNDLRSGPVRVSALAEESPPALLNQATEAVPAASFLSEKEKELLTSSLNDALDSDNMETVLFASFGLENYPGFTMSDAAKHFILAHLSGPAGLESLDEKFQLFAAAAILNLGFDLRKGQLTRIIDVLMGHAGIRSDSIWQVFLASRSLASIWDFLPKARRGASQMGLLGFGGLRSKNQGEKFRAAIGLSMSKRALNADEREQVIDILTNSPELNVDDAYNPLFAAIGLANLGIKSSRVRLDEIGFEVLNNPRAFPTRNIYDLFISCLAFSAIYSNENQNVSMELAFMKSFLSAEHGLNSGNRDDVFASSVGIGALTFLKPSGTGYLVDKLDKNERDIVLRYFTLFLNSHVEGRYFAALALTNLNIPLTSTDRVRIVEFLSGEAGLKNTSLGYAQLVSTLALINLNADLSEEQLQHILNVIDVSIKRKTSMLAFIATLVLSKLKDKIDIKEIKQQVDFLLNSQQGMRSSDNAQAYQACVALANLTEFMDANQRDAWKDSIVNLEPGEDVTLNHMLNLIVDGKIPGMNRNSSLAFLASRNIFSDYSSVETLIAAIVLSMNSDKLAPGVMNWLATGISADSHLPDKKFNALLALCTIKSANSSDVAPVAEEVAVEDSGKAQKILSDWKRNVLGEKGAKRDELIARAQKAYQPFLELIPEEHRGEIEKKLEDLVTLLYNEQDAQVRAQFQASADKEVDVNSEELIFNRFRSRMEQIYPVLKARMPELLTAISQESFAVQKGILEDLFVGLFKLSANSGLNVETVNASLVIAIAAGWDVSNETQLRSLSVITDFIAGLRQVDPYIGIGQIRKIVRFVSLFVGRDPANHMPILEGQIRVILDKKPEVRKVYLEKMLNAFRDVENEALTEYLNQPTNTKGLGKAREIVVFLTNKVKHLESRERFVPKGKELIPAGMRIKISQVEGLMAEWLKTAPDTGRGKKKIMPIKVLIDAIMKRTLPEANEFKEQKILLDTKVQRESGARTAEIAQNSLDGTRGKKGELGVSFYLQNNGKESVEEAGDNGTGAADAEVALIIDVSSKDEGKQVGLDIGNFGTGKKTYFENVDRLEIITKSSERAYMLTFNVERDSLGNPVELYLSSMIEIDDPSVAQGLAVRFIKLVENTVPELDRMLAERSWKTFAGLAQNDNFKISFVERSKNSAGEEVIKKTPLEVKSKTLSSSDFNVVVPRTDENRNFGAFRLLSAEDMPQQVVDKAGLRIGEIKEEYLALIPQALRRHIKDLGLVIQIPLPLIRNRSDFEHAKDYLPFIQKYVAIEFYKAVAYLALTQNSPQFVFEGFSLDWETNDDYWSTIDLNDEQIVSLARNINEGNYNSINEEDLAKLLTEKGRLDKAKKFLKLVLLLKINVGNGKFENLLLRRLAIQRERNSARAAAQRNLLLQAGMEIEEREIPDVKDVPHYREKLSQAGSIERGHQQMQEMIASGKHLVKEKDYTQQERDFVERVRPIAKLFGLEDVVLVESYVSFAGGFIKYAGKDVIALNRSLTDLSGISVSGHLDKTTDTIVHELAHLLEELMRQDDAETLFEKGYVSSIFTHDSIGTFAEAMKYVAEVILYNHTQSVEAVREAQLKAREALASLENETVPATHSPAASASAPAAPAPSAPALRNTVLSGIAALSMSAASLFGAEKQFSVNHAPSMSPASPQATSLDYNYNQSPDARRIINLVENNNTFEAIAAAEELAKIAVGSDTAKAQQAYNDLVSILRSVKDGKVISEAFNLLLSIVNENVKTGKLNMEGLLEALAWQQEHTPLPLVADKFGNMVEQLMMIPGFVATVYRGLDQNQAIALIKTSIGSFLKNPADLKSFYTIMSLYESQYEPVRKEAALAIIRVAKTGNPTAVEALVALEESGNPEAKAAIQTVVFDLTKNGNTSVVFSKGYAYKYLSQAQLRSAVASLKKNQSISWLWRFIATGENAPSWVSQEAVAVLTKLVFEGDSDAALYLIQAAEQGIVLGEDSVKAVKDAALKNPDIRAAINSELASRWYEDSSSKRTLQMQLIFAADVLAAQEKEFNNPGLIREIVLKSQDQAIRIRGFNLLLNQVLSGKIKVGEYWRSFILLEEIARSSDAQFAKAAVAACIEQYRAFKARSEAEGAKYDDVMRVNQFGGVLWEFVKYTADPEVEKTAYDFLVLREIRLSEGLIDVVRFTAKPALKAKAINALFELLKQQGGASKSEILQAAVDGTIVLSPEQMDALLQAVETGWSPTPTFLSDFAKSWEKSNLPQEQKDVLLKIILRTLSSPVYGVDDMVSFIFSVNDKKLQDEALKNLDRLISSNTEESMRYLMSILDPHANIFFLRVLAKTFETKASIEDFKAKERLVTSVISRHITELLPLAKAGNKLAAYLLSWEGVADNEVKGNPVIDELLLSGRRTTRGPGYADDAFINASVRLALDPAFSALIKGKSKAEAFAINQNTVMILRQHQKAFTQENLLAVSRWVVERNTAMKNVVLIGPKIGEAVVIAHDEATSVGVPRFGGEDVRSLLESLGMKGKPISEIRLAAGVMQSADNKVRLRGLGQMKDRVTQALGRTHNYILLYYLDGHGGPDHFWFTNGEIGKETSDDLSDARALSYIEVAKALFESWKKGQDLSLKRFILGSCYSYASFDKAMVELRRLQKEYNKGNKVVLTYSEPAFGLSVAYRNEVGLSSASTVDSNGKYLGASPFVAAVREVTTGSDSFTYENFFQANNITIKGTDGLMSSDLGLLISDSMIPGNLLVEFNALMNGLENSELKEEKTDVIPPAPSGMQDGGFEGSVGSIDRANFLKAWRAGFDPGISESHRNVLTDRTGFRIPQVRLVTQEEMDAASDTKGIKVLRMGDGDANRILIVNSYWFGLSEEQKLDILMHEAMADWMEQRHVPAEDIAIDIEGLKVDEAKRRAAHTADIDNSMEGGKEPDRKTVAMQGGQLVGAGLSVDITGNKALLSKLSAKYAARLQSGDALPREQEFLSGARFYSITVAGPGEVIADDQAALFCNRIVVLNRNNNRVALIHAGNRDDSGFTQSVIDKALAAIGINEGNRSDALAIITRPNDPVTEQEGFSRTVETLYSRAIDALGIPRLESDRHLAWGSQAIRLAVEEGVLLALSGQGEILRAIQLKSSSDLALARAKEILPSAIEPGVANQEAIKAAETQEIKMTPVSHNGNVDMSYSLEASQNLEKMLVALAVPKGSVVLNVGSGRNPLMVNGWRVINIDKSTLKNISGYEISGADFFSDNLLEELGLKERPAVVLFYNMWTFFSIYGPYSVGGSDNLMHNTIINYQIYLNRARELLNSEGKIILVDFMAPEGVNGPALSEASGNLPKAFNITDIFKNNVDGKDIALVFMSLNSTGRKNVSKTENPGGIDFRALPIVTQPMTGSGSSPINPDTLKTANINLDQEWRQIQDMLNAGITPSIERIKEYIKVSCKSNDCQARLDWVLSGIADMLRLEEERSTITEAALKQVLVLLESNSSAVQIELALTKIQVLPKDPILIGK